MDKKIIILAVVLMPFIAIAQDKFNLSGTVTDSQSNEKVELVAVQIKELNIWTTSDINGTFKFTNIPKGIFTIQASCLGFEYYENPITIKRNVVGYKLMMKRSSLGLDEVVVTAKENTSLSSSSKIESTALDHVQPNSLADVMQLVPGQITLNPDMSGSNQITIRDINRASASGGDSNAKPDANSAMGTAIYVDGTPINNDANMQTLNTSGGVGQSYSTAGQGVDLRQISTDNIESVEVIRGIPSVEYGNLTTGAVVVKTKAGKSKWYTKLKADPKIKQLALSKGFLVPGENNGAFNIDFDYTHSMDQLTMPTRSYRRLTGQLGYSNTFFRASTPLSLNAKVNYFSTFDNQKNDADMLREEILEAKEEKFGFKLYGNWSVKKPWLTSVVYNFAGNFQKQETYEYKVTSVQNNILGIGTSSGEWEALFLPASYFSELWIDGKPYNYFGTIKANITGRYGAITNNIMLGAEYRVSGNNGDGRIYDVTRPPSGSTTTRPRAFSDIPANKELSLFIEEKASIPIGSTKLNAQVGLRYTNLLPKGIFETDGFTTLEPRVNVVYEIIKRKRSQNFKDLSLRFGYGKTSKTPGMIYLYPDKKYNDKLSFNYYPELAIQTTNVVDDTSNQNLKPAVNTKYEAGVDFNLLGVSVMLTAFSENLINGFSYNSVKYVMDYKKWESLEGLDRNPVYEDGEISYTENGQTRTLPYTWQQEFVSYKSPFNNYEIRKRGIEYVVNFGQIQAIKSTLIVDGAYFNILKLDEVKPYTETVGVSYLGKKFPYVTVFPGGEGTERNRLNSNIKINTHIPKLRMVTSITAMMIWFENKQYYWRDDNGNEVSYILGSNNEKIYGQYNGGDDIYVDPIGYYDYDMTFHKWQSDYNFETPYYFMVKKRREDYFEKTVYPFSWQINLKLTKEIGNKLKLSFFANNVFNHRPLVKIERSDSYVRRNQTAYFGAELKFTL